MNAEAATERLTFSASKLDHWRGWVTGIGMAGLTLLAWMIRHGYEGITHDARLYSFQAMAHLKPELLGQDLYLRLGSQDSYTVFSPLHAMVIGWLGMEPAAALITLISQTAFLIAAWLLARRLMSCELAWLSVGLLLTVPSVYASGSVWSFLEGFVTPRLACEALVLAATAAMLAKRYSIACLTLAVGLVIHPLMAVVGIVMALYIHFMPLPRSVIAGLFGLAALAMVIAFAIPADSPLRMDEQWLSLFDTRQPFLFIAKWSAQDWARTAVHLTTLLIGFATFPRGSAPSLLCLGSTLIGLAGLLLSAIAGDVLHIALILQAQPWRWLWLAAVLSVMLIGPIATSCWHAGLLGRIAVALLIVVWLSVLEPYTILIAPLAIAIAAMAARGKVIPEGRRRVVIVGTTLLLTLVAVRSIANSMLDAAAFPDESAMPLFVRQIRMFSKDGLLPSLVFIAFWWMLTSPRFKSLRPALAAICVIASLALLPASAGEWRRTSYTQQNFNAFAEWRKHIPIGEEVLWGGGGVETWALLERPRYLAEDQTASILFSRPAAMALRERGLRLVKYSERDSYMLWTEDKDLVRRGVEPTLAEICAAIDARFVVSNRPVSATPLADSPKGASPRYRGVKLYKCAR